MAVTPNLSLESLESVVLVSWRGAWYGLRPPGVWSLFVTVLGAGGVLQALSIQRCCLFLMPSEDHSVLRPGILLSGVSGAVTRPGAWPSPGSVDALSQPCSPFSPLQPRAGRQWGPAQLRSGKDDHGAEHAATRDGGASRRVCPAALGPGSCREQSWSPRTSLFGRGLF